MEFKNRNMNFNEVPDETYYEEFYDENGKVVKESIIETIFQNVTLEATNFCASMIKANPPQSRSYTDGWIRFRKSRLQKDIDFYGIQETKRGFKRTSVNYWYQLAQALCYYVMFNKEDCKVLIIDSDTYFDYLIIDQNKDVIDELINEFREALAIDSPCKACKKLGKCLKGKFKIVEKDIPSDRDVSECFEEIYNNCL